MEKISARELHKRSFFYENKQRTFLSLQNPSARGRISPSGHAVSPSHHLGAPAQLLKGASPSSRPFRGLCIKTPVVFPAGRLRCRCRSLVQPRPAAWAVPRAGSSIVTAPEPKCPSPRSHLEFPAALKFPRCTKQKREEKAFHHRSREPTYKNLTLPLPGSLAASQGFGLGPCGPRQGQDSGQNPKIPGSPGSPRHGSPRRGWQIPG